MTPRMRVSKAGLELIKSFEGYRADAARLADGGWTVGYGHIRSAREGARVSEADAEALLVYDLRQIEAVIHDAVFAPVTQGQFDALASLAFNIGTEAFAGSDVVRHLNAGEVIAAANGFDAWRRARVEGRAYVVDALVRRRAVEKALFLEHPGGRAVAPSPVVRPELDIASAILAARDPAIKLDTPLNGPRAEAHASEQALTAVDTANAASRPQAAAAAVVERLTRLIDEGERRAQTLIAETLSAGSAAPEALLVADSLVAESLVPQSLAPEGLEPDGLPTTGLSLAPEPVEVLVAKEPRTLIIDPDVEGERLPQDDDLGEVVAEGKPEPGQRAAIDTLPPMDLTAPPVEQAPEAKPGEGGGRFFSALPYGLIALLGGAFIAFGGWQYWQLVQSGRAVAQNELLAGPLLVLVGIIGLVFGTYYFIKQLVTDDEPIG